MKKSVLIFLVFFQAIFCFGQDNPTHQSIISLIANKEQYVDKKIILKGFLNLEKHDMALYLSKDDYLNLNIKNAIFLFMSMDDMNKLSIGKMNRKYVSITGTFFVPKFKDQNMYDNYSGVLKNIEYVEVIEQRKNK
jgi:hypothetical protein